MSSSTSTSLLSSADYADALLTARKAKLALFVVLVVAIVAQLTLFFMIHYKNALHLPEQSANSKSGTAKVEVITRGMGRAATPAPVAEPTAADLNARQLVQYGIGVIDFVGIIAPILLVVVLLLTLQIQLVTRLIGVRQVTSALMWSALLALLLFPWQAVLNNPAINYEPTNNDLGLKVPGVLYTWAEVSHPTLGAMFKTGDDLKADILHWARYVGWPVAALMLLVVVHVKSNRGLRLSLGETVPSVEIVPVE